MDLLVLSGAAVHDVLDYAGCAAAMRSALAARARGEVFQPLRSVLRPDGAAGLMALMPAYQSAPGAGYGLKAICITPGNPAAGLDTHQGIVLLSSPDTGEPLAVLNASAVTEIRTAAVSAVATSLLARPDATVLAIIGTGVQARAHLAAIRATRPLSEVRVAGSSPAKAAAFAARANQAAGARAAGDQVGADPVAADVPVVACESAREAVSGAGIIVTATTSATPVLERGWLASGAHINAVGACLPHLRELDSATMAAAAIFADSRESVLAESGDYLLAAADGVIGPGQIRAEIGDLQAGLAPDLGRRDADEITVFESLGLAVEDLAAAAAAYQIARARGAGSWVSFG
jgi:ornithine cyclodeaminase/alanine dehydrogenase-like protein (mu-crystallin family)